MTPSIHSAARLWGLAFLTVCLAGVALAADTVETVFDKFVQAASHTDWPAEVKARNELVSLGQTVVPKLAETAQGHSNARVRRSCYELLTDSFPKDERTIDTLIRCGLLDQDPQIQYHAAFLLGDLKVERAEPSLRAAFEKATGKDERFLRYTLAKSLAQLGKADVLPALWAAVTDDAYMSRHVGNIGLHALTGKNLNDFEGYTYGEGAFVSGGKEASTAFDAITIGQKKAGRFRAAVGYFKWLKKDRPELYRFVTYPRKPDNDRP